MSLRVLSRQFVRNTDTFAWAIGWSFSSTTTPATTFGSGSLKCLRYSLKSVLGRGSRVDLAAGFSSSACGLAANGTRLLWLFRRFLSEMTAEAAAFHLAHSLKLSIPAATVAVR